MHDYYLSFWNQKNPQVLGKSRLKLRYGKFVQLYYFLLKSLPEFNANLFCLGTNTNTCTLAHTHGHACTHTHTVKPFCKWWL